MDLSTGQQVTNLIYATIVSESRLWDLKEYLEEVKKDQPEIEFRIDRIN